MWNDINLGITVNLKAMKLFGVETATYFAVLTQIIPRVIAKQTADEDGYFILDRNYIESQIGLNREKQYNCDSILSRHGILITAADSRDKISLDIKLWVGLIAESDPDKLAEVIKKSALPKTILDRDAANARAAAKAEERAKKAEQAKLERIRKEEKKAKDAENKEKKEQGIRITMKNIASHQPIAAVEEIKAALETWVDSIYDSKNFLTKAAIEIFCNKIKDYSSDVAVQKELVEIATVRSYKDATFVFDVYQRSHAGTPAKVAAPQKIATVGAVRQDVLF